jgi:hypothetical protein
MASDISRRQFAIGAALMVAGDGLRRPLNAPAAGQVSYGIPPNSSGVIVARQVIVFGPAGNATGVFVYAPGTTPGLGNPPITWESSGLVDPFGNVLPSTTGVAGTGTFQAGDTVINTAGIFTYSGTPALGNLIAADVNAAGTDQFGNLYPAGQSSLLPSGGATPGLVAQLYQGAASFGTLAAVNFTGGRSPAFVSGTGIDGSITVYSGTTGATDAPVNLILQSKTTSGLPQGLAQLNSPLSFGQATQPPAPGAGSTIYSDNTGTLAAINASDGLRVGLGSRVVQTVATITVNTANTAAPIAILAPNVGAVSYQFEALIIYVGNANAGAPILVWGGSSGIATLVGESYFTAAAGGSAGLNSQVFNGAFVNGTGPVLISAGKGAYRAVGNITFSTAGNLTLGGACTVAADTWAVGIGSYIKLVPTS